MTKSVHSYVIEFCTTEWPKRNQLVENIKCTENFEIVLLLVILCCCTKVALLYHQVCSNRPLWRYIMVTRVFKDVVASSVWWPRVTNAFKQFVQSCPTCQRVTVPHREPLLTNPLPSYPWEHVAADLFELKCSTYLLVADYYSRFVEVQKLTITTSSGIVTQLKAIFARFGIPATLITDNGPQFDSQHMKEFLMFMSFSTLLQALTTLKQMDLQKEW